MIGFWIIEFEQNEDRSIIEYKNFRSMHDQIHPEMSICIANPFLVNKFETSGSNVSIKDYISYLSGNGSFDQGYVEIDFFNITLNVFDYLKEVWVKKADNTWTRDYCELKNGCELVSMKNNFNGLVGGIVNKCFGIRIKQQFAKTTMEIWVEFDIKMKDILSQMRNHAIGKYFHHVSVEFAYPGQFLRTNFDKKIIWEKQNEEATTEWFTIITIEVLKRRNKINDPCFEDWLHYDDFVLNKHISSINCKNPYQRQTGSLCNTTSGMLSSRYEADIVREKYFPPPCQEITDVKYKSNKIVNRFNDGLFISVVYPNRMRLISQVRSVDAHTLIGNIGGYIGLFIGTILES